MKSLTRLTIAIFASALLALTAVAGTESLPSGKEMKEVAPLPPPPLCDWAGFYIGVHGGGQFGHSETNDLDEYYFFAHHHFGYSESGFIGGGQAGYNFQFRKIVFGPEFDLGYMNLDGSGDEPQRQMSIGTASGETDSDFYVTLRGRVGYALDWHGCWLLYATGGAIGVNYHTRFVAEQLGMVNGTDASNKEFNWGPTVGGGIERQIGRRWSIKIEYLYFTLGEQSFSGAEERLRVPNAALRLPLSEVYRFEGETAGHIVRAGLNFHF